MYAEAEADFSSGKAKKWFARAGESATGEG
jgi:hypothetical protein